jgi:hypothetical protein
MTKWIEEKREPKTSKSKITHSGKLEIDRLNEKKKKKKRYHIKDKWK